MPRGGYRPGAGRPKGSKTLRVDVRKRASATGQTPLEFMLSVMNDETQDMNTRLRMAAAAAPFIHGRKVAGELGKRAQAAEDAETAAEETGWEDLVNPSREPADEF